MKAKHNSQTVSKASLPDPPQITNIETNTGDTISLETFPRDCRKVRFTEAESIEAIKRLGLTVADFNYRPQSDFKRPGCDDSVTQLLYSKSEKRRQDIIAQALEMRRKIIDEKEKEKTSPKKESSAVKLQRRGLELEQKSFEKLQRDRNGDLKKLIIQQLRDLFNRQLHYSAVERSNQRIQEAERKKTEMLQVAQSRAITLPAIVPTKQEPYVIPVDKQLERLKEQRQKEDEERRKKAQEHTQKMNQAFERSASLFEKMRENREQRIGERDARFQNWQKNRNEALSEKHRIAAERSVKEGQILQSSLRLEEERRQRWMEKIKLDEQRSKSATDRRTVETKDKLEQIRQRITERVQKARDTQSLQYKMREEFRKKLDDTEAEVEKRRQSRSQQLQLKFIERQFDRDTRSIQVQQKRAAEEHMAVVRHTKMIEDESAAVAIQAQTQKVAMKKEIEQNKYNATRTKILGIFNTMSDHIDEQGIKDIQQIMGIDDKEMESLIAAAKAPTAGTKTSRPSTAQSDRVTVEKLPQMSLLSQPTVVTSTRSKSTVTGRRK